MKIVIAVDSFKGSCASLEAARGLERGALKVFPDAEIIKIPVADGGEGTVEALCSVPGTEKLHIEVTDPLGRPHMAKYGVLADGTAVMEMAEASGITLVGEDKNPYITTTYGTGELIRAALDRGCRRIILGIGGSATNDGGAGMAQALGVRLMDKDGKEPERGGLALERLARADISGLDKRLGMCDIMVASDVNNPLCGERGASAIFGPQKGATPEMVRRLDKALYNYGSILKTQLGADYMDAPGAGAAGGLGFGLMAFCGARLSSGVETVLKAVGFEKALSGADMVFTGEGRMDKSSAFGKAPAGVASIARKYGIPVVAFTGSLGEGADGLYKFGLDALVPIADGPMTLEYSIAHAEDLLEGAAERAMRLFNIKR